MIVRQEIERHRRNISEELIKRRSVRGGRDVIAMTTPDRRLLIPGGGNREDHRFRHRVLACHSPAKRSFDRESTSTSLLNSRLRESRNDRRLLAYSAAAGAGSAGALCDASAFCCRIISSRVAATQIGRASCRERGCTAVAD